MPSSSAPCAPPPFFSQSSGQESCSAGGGGRGSSPLVVQASTSLSLLDEELLSLGKLLILQISPLNGLTEHAELLQVHYEILQDVPSVDVPRKS